MATSNPCPQCLYQMRYTYCERLPSECSGFGCPDCGYGCDYGLVPDKESNCMLELTLQTMSDMQLANVVVQEARADSALRERP